MQYISQAIHFRPTEVILQVFEELNFIQFLQSSFVYDINQNGTYRVLWSAKIKIYA